LATQKTGGVNCSVMSGMLDSDNFIYAEVASSRGGVFRRNQLVEVDELPSVIRHQGGYELFSSYYRFDDGLRQHMANNGGSVAAYRGPCHTSVVHLDIDAGDLDVALGTARELSYFLLECGADDRALYPYFSGRRGFHLAINAAVFGCLEPDERVPNLVDRLIMELVAAAGVTHPKTIDYQIAKRLSLLRLPHTRHRSGLYKVPLRLHELMGWDVERIVAEARSPRESDFTDVTGLRPRYDVQPLPDTQELFERCTAAIRTRPAEDLPPADDFLDSDSLENTFCEAELKLYQNGVAEHHRTWTALRLASRMRAAGHCEEEAVRVVLGWNERNQPPEEAGDVRRAVESSYSSLTPYSFGCTGNDPATALVSEVCPYRGGNRMECEVYRKFTEAWRARRVGCEAKIEGEQTVSEEIARHGQSG